MNAIQSLVGGLWGWFLTALVIFVVWRLWSGAARDFKALMEGGHGLLGAAFTVVFGHNVVPVVALLVAIAVLGTGLTWALQDVRTWVPKVWSEVVLTKSILGNTVPAPDKLLTPQAVPTEVPSAPVLVTPMPTTQLTSPIAPQGVVCMFSRLCGGRYVVQGSCRPCTP